MPPAKTRGCLIHASPPTNALDVFRHPFAYAAYRGLERWGPANEPALPVAA